MKQMNPLLLLSERLFLSCNTQYGNIAIAIRTSSPKNPFGHINCLERNLYQKGENNNVKRYLR